MSTSDDAPDTPARRRPPPIERFAGPERVVDLPAVTAALREEPAAAAAPHGHRQTAVLHRGPVRMVVFAFDAGGRLPTHTADGLVTIHVLRGALTVTTPEAHHPLGAGAVLVLDPRIPHDVVAAEPADMLLTVHLHAVA